MLHVDVVCVGSLKERYLREACAEYEKRLGGFCRLTVTEVGEERLPDKPSEAAVAAALQAEGRRLLDKVPENVLLTALCIEGKEMSSVELTERIQNWSVSGEQPAGFCYRRILGTFPGGQTGGPPATFHVAYDLSSSAGTGYAAGTAVPRYADCCRREIP